MRCSTPYHAIAGSSANSYSPLRLWLETPVPYMQIHDVLSNFGFSLASFMREPRISRRVCGYQS